MREQGGSQYDLESSRCAGKGSSGRCQCRGSIGNASASGGRWLCAWHNEVIEYGLFPSRENFEYFLIGQEELGDERYKGRSADHWWNLVQGVSGPGAFDIRKGDEYVIPHHEPREVPGY